jgi:hypothetical protein
MVAVLKASGDNLTRDNVMKQAASLHNLVLPMLLPGITLSTSPDCLRSPAPPSNPPPSALPPSASQLRWPWSGCRGHW